MGLRFEAGQETSEAINTGRVSHAAGGLVVHRHHHHCHHHYHCRMIYFQVQLDVILMLKVRTNFNSLELAQSELFISV